MRRTHRVVIVDEGWKTCSLAAELSARIVETHMYELDAPIRRVCTAEVPIPYAQHLEQGRPAPTRNDRGHGEGGDGPMSGEFCMPSLGADMDAGTLVEWLVKPGDAVKRGDIVAVVETQKGAIDVEIYEDGVIERLVVDVGTEVPVGTVLATLVGHEETERPSVATPAPTPAATASPPSSPVPPSSTRVAASPRARRRATELGVALDAITGTGPRGAITFDDVEAAARTTTSAPGGDAMRAAIAAAMSRANREIPHYYLGHTVDLEPALSWLEAGNRDRPVRERILPIAVLVRGGCDIAARVPAAVRLVPRRSLRPVRPDRHRPRGGDPQRRPAQPGDPGRRRGRPARAVGEDQGRDRARAQGRTAGVRAGGRGRSRSAVSATGASTRSTG